MPKIAILSDIHANLQAFRSVLSDVGTAGVDAIAICGDFVGYGAQPLECVQMAMKLNAVCILGNHDLWALQVKKQGPSFFSEDWVQDPVIAGLAYAANALGPEEGKWLEGLPYFCAIDGAVVVHASLDKPAAWHYVDSPETAEASLAILHGQERNIAFCGHTHRQAIFTESGADYQTAVLDGEKIEIPESIAALITVGSVGQPREQKHDPRAGWAIWDSKARTVEFRRTEYDVVAAANSIIAAKLPVESAFRLLR